MRRGQEGGSERPRWPSPFRDIIFDMARRDSVTARERSVFPGFSSLAQDPDRLIDSLAAIRRERGLSQTEVAARMGTSQSALARLESSHADVRLSTVMRYATALGVDVGFSVRDRTPGDHDEH